MPPLGPGVRYRYKKGTKVRLAFKGGKVVEARNMETGKTHTPQEFADDEAKEKALDRMGSGKGHGR